MGDWFLLTMVKRNLDDRQFTSWIKEVEESICEKESVRRERERGKRNGHTWVRHGARERKGWSGEEGEGREGEVPRAEKESSGGSLASQEEGARA